LVYEARINEQILFIFLCNYYVITVYMEYQFL